MTAQDVRDCVELVRDAARQGDHEQAHSFEDGLFRDVLYAVANGMCEDACECARAACESMTIDFVRRTS